jgi:hypothetical protein
LKIKKVDIQPLEIFKIPPEFINSEKYNEIIKNGLKDKPLEEWKKELKAKEAEMFVTNEDGTSFQCVPFYYKNHTIAGLAPNLVQAYFDLAFEHIQWTERYKETLLQTANNKFESVKIADENVFTRFIQYRLSGIVFLHLTVEAFLNHLIPDDHIYEKVEKSKTDRFIQTTTTYNKAQIERWLTFKEKIDDVVFTLKNINNDKEKIKPLRENIIELAKIRDEIVHLKSDKNATKTYYKKIFEFISTKDLFKYIYGVRDFINLLSPDFIKINEYDIDRQSYKIAVTDLKCLNFGVLLEVTRLNYGTIELTITKTKEIKESKPHIEFLFKHIPIMEKMKIITDYQIEETDTEYVIEFYKTNLKQE